MYFNLGKPNSFLNQTASKSERVSVKKGFIVHVLLWPYKYVSSTNFQGVITMKPAYKSKCKKKVLNQIPETRTNIDL